MVKLSRIQVHGPYTSPADVTHRQHAVRCDKRAIC